MSLFESLILFYERAGTHGVNAINALKIKASKECGWLP